MGFRFANTQALLTYKGHLDKEKTHEFLDNLGVREVVAIVIAWENGEDGDYPHTHVVVKWDKPFQTTDVRKFDIDGVHPNIKVLPSKKGFIDGMKYISKEDKEVYKAGDVPEETISFDVRLEAVMNAKTKKEVMQMANTASEIIPFLTANEAFHGETEDMDSEDEEYWKWFMSQELNENQKIWYSKLKDQDYRKVLWICDYKGNTGKSFFGQWLDHHHNAFEMIGQWEKDVAQWNGSKWIYLDLSRANEDYVGFYTAIEKMKNGRARSGRYKGKKWTKKRPPRVVVFANFYPNTRLLSEDRWDIIVINDDKTCDDDEW